MAASSMITVVDNEEEMSTITASSTDVIIDLSSNNVCKRCCLRYLNERTPEAYKNVDKYLKIVFEAGNVSEEQAVSVKHRKLNPCSACLGLLQLSENDEFLEEIKERILEAGFDADDVTFALSLPITILLRDYSVWLYISDKYASYFGGTPGTVSSKRLTNTVSVKEAWKLTTAQTLADKLNKSMHNGIDGSFHVNIQIEYDKDVQETKCLIGMFPHIFKNRPSQKRKFHGEVLTRKSVENALPSVGLQFFKTHYPVPPNVPDCSVRCGNIECLKDSIYFAGRYNKYSRNLSQTPWLINGQRRLESSVEEIIGNPVARVIKHSGIKFSSSGREDVDVRTLGRGRPFILEILNPRKTRLYASELKQIEDYINESTKDVFVRDLQVVTKDDLALIKLGEQTKSKTYNCLCLTKLTDGESVSHFKDKLTELGKVQNLDIQQKTPIRVLHRRSLAVRPKTIFWLKPEFYENKDDLVFFKLNLQVSAGTYIKEFVHGDFGRTKPSLSEILKREVDILALDVEEVALEWPPSIDYP